MGKNSGQIRVEFGSTLGQIFGRIFGRIFGGNGRIFGIRPKPIFFISVVHQIKNLQRKTQIEVAMSNKKLFLSLKWFQKRTLFFELNQNILKKQVFLKPVNPKLQYPNPKGSYQTNPIEPEPEKFWTRSCTNE